MFTSLKNNYKQNKRYFLLTLWISLLSIVPQLFMYLNVKHFVSLIFLSLFLFVSSHLNKYLFAFFILFLNTVNIFQTHVALHWGGYTGNLSPRINVTLSSPSYEKIEYLTTYLDYRDYLMLIYSLAIVILLILLLKKRPHLRSMQKVFLLPVLILFAILQNQEPLRVAKDFYYVKQRTDITTSRNTFLQAYQSTPLPQPLYDKIIIIQGESANKHFLNLYGYPDNTTPYLSKLNKEGLLYTFNTIAPSNQTRYAIPMLYTDATVSNWEEGFINSPSLLSEFKNAHYKTSWISNQGEQGEHEDYITNIANEADVTYFLEKHCSCTYSDQSMVDYLQRNQVNQLKEFAVFHLIGSHFNYALRYDHNNSLYPTPTSIVEQYANSIHFTDYVIKQVIKHYSKTNQTLLVIYLSDHGEVVSHDLHGHGYEPAFRDEYEIPLIVYSNIHNERLEILKNIYTKKYFNGEDFNLFVKYISGLSNNKNLSHASHVLGIDLSLIYSYEKLPHYKKSTLH